MRAGRSQRGRRKGPYGRSRGATDRRAAGARRAGRAGRGERVRRVVVRLSVLAIALTVVALGAAMGTRRLARAVAAMEFFRVEQIEVNNLRYLDRATVLALAAVPAGVSVWDDPTPYVERLEHSPLVANVSVRRALPGTLVFRIDESEPVALLPTPTLEPIDAEGRVLPIDPSALRLDLPLLRASLDPIDPNFLSSHALRTLLEEVVRLRDVVPELSSRVSSIGFAPDGAVEVSLFSPDITLLYRAPATEERLVVGFEVLGNARRERPDQAPQVIDLRFEDQVVVRFADARG